MSNYEILGLKRGATLKEIKAKFRELAMKTHPDKGGNAEIFIKINNAYEALLRGETGENPLQQAYNASTKKRDSNFKTKPKVAEYRFEGITKNSNGYLVSFFMDGVDYVEIFGKDSNRIGYYNTRGKVGSYNLTIMWDEAKKGDYIFECWLHDGRGKMAKVTYKVEPPKKPSLWERVKKVVKNLIK